VLVLAVAITIAELYLRSKHAKAEAKEAEARAEWVPFTGTPKLCFVEFLKSVLILKNGYIHSNVSSQGSAYVENC
jgi:hypothetical protein